MESEEVMALVSGRVNQEILARNEYLPQSAWRVVEFLLPRCGMMLQMKWDCTIRRNLYLECKGCAFEAI